MPSLKLTVEMSDEQSAMLTELAKQSGVTKVDRAARIVLAHLDYQIQQKPVAFVPPQNSKSLYGVTPRQLKTRFANQGKKCAICGTTNRAYRVDHTEPCGQPFVRGILCDGCNRVLGYYDDVPDYIRDCIKRNVAPKESLGQCKNLTGMAPRQFEQVALSYLESTEKAVKRRNGGKYPVKVWNDNQTKRVWRQE